MQKIKNKGKGERTREEL